jgi:UDP-3-O-[3-hydroxymyristoyl] glucosamine N-acyltransferase
MSDQAGASNCLPNGVVRTLTVREIAEAVEGAVAGDGSVPIGGVASITDAEHGDIVFAETPRFLDEAQRSRASAVVAFLDAVSPDKPLIRVENPRFAFSRVLELFSPRLTPPIGVDETAIVGARAEIAPTASIGPYVVIGDDVRIGERTIILSGCHIGDGVQIGEDTILHPHVAIYPNCVVGARVIVHAGAVIGSDGFGFVRIGNRAHKVPHIGIVEVQDDVEIGANVTIDRAKTGATVIGARTKIDNLVQVAHNVKIGPDSIVAALAGIAGSANLGRGTVIAGQVGVRDHVTIGDGAMLLGQAGAWGDVSAGAVVSGSPAKPHRLRLRELAAAERGPEMIRRVAALEARIAELSARLSAMEQSEQSEHAAGSEPAKQQDGTSA